MRGRIRTIKPEAFLDEELWDLELESGLPIFRAFVGLWTQADREGRFEWRPRALKAQVLPYWEGDFSRVLDALTAARFLVRYEVAGKAYGLIRTFRTHQVINQREAKSTIPEPGEVRARADTGAHVHARASANVPDQVRAAVFERDGSRCVRCGSAEDLTIDHIFPRSLGGTHALANLRILCRACNSARPVQGEALAADLAKDGLALKDLPRICTHVHARGEGKGREGNGREPVRARARGDGSEPEGSAPWTGYDGPKTRNAFVEAWPLPQVAPPKHPDAWDPYWDEVAAWCDAQAKAEGTMHEAVLAKLLAAFWADDWCRQTGYKPRALLSEATRLYVAVVDSSAPPDPARALADRIREEIDPDERNRLRGELAKLHAERRRDAEAS